MSSLTIKNLPASLLTQLRERARRNRRSLNKEILFLLEQTVELDSLPLETSRSALKYPLRGLPFEYAAPFQSIAEDEWEALE